MRSIPCRGVSRRIPHNFRHSAGHEDRDDGRVVSTFLRALRLVSAWQRTGADDRRQPQRNVHGHRMKSYREFLGRYSQGPHAVDSFMAGIDTITRPRNPSYTTPRGLTPRHEVTQTTDAKSKAELRGAGLCEYCLGEPGRTFGSIMLRHR